MSEQPSKNEVSVNDNEDALSEEALGELKSAFNVLDMDGDGNVTVKELEICMQQAGYKVSDAVIDDMMQEIDVDCSGSVDFTEFMGMVSRTNEDTERSDELLEAFRRFDHGKTGYLRTEDVKRILRGVHGDAVLSEDFIIDVISEMEPMYVSGMGSAYKYADLVGTIMTKSLNGL